MRLSLTGLLVTLACLSCEQDGGSGAAQSHMHGAHDGLATTFAGGDTNGYLELKLHDDKGDIELWLAQDDHFARPFLIAYETKPVLEFLDHDGRKIELAVRNQEKNEGEDGSPHMVADQTNYFIFPGETGAESTWLTGKEFSSRVVLRFKSGDIEYESAPMTLQPHSH